MRWIEVRDIQDPTPGNKLHMIVAATGKPLVLPIEVIEYRRGNLIFVKNWIYRKLAPYLVPTGSENERRTPEGNGQVLPQPQSVGPGGSASVS